MTDCDKTPILHSSWHMRCGCRRNIAIRKGKAEVNISRVLHEQAVVMSGVPSGLNGVTVDEGDKRARLGRRRQHNRCQMAVSYYDLLSPRLFVWWLWCSSRVLFLAQIKHKG